MNGEKSPWNKLVAWLRDWAQHNLGEAGRTKKRWIFNFVESIRFSTPSTMDGWSRGLSFQGSSAEWTSRLHFFLRKSSSLLGVGKTTCAKMACEVLGFQTVEMNASDVRNKKHLEVTFYRLFCNKILRLMLLNWQVPINLKNILVQLKVLLYWRFFLKTFRSH